MELVAGRRLTGPNLHGPGPGAIAEVRFDPTENQDQDPHAALRAAAARLSTGLSRLGWEGEVRTRVFGSGLGGEILVPAPVDRLYATVELVEWAVSARDADDGRVEAAEEQTLRAVSMLAIARAETLGTYWRIDDDDLSIGRGAKSQT